MIKILFICHGNICRSPMAEFMMKDLVKKEGVADSFYIASAATSSEEVWNGIGNPVYPPAKAELSKHGIGGFEKKRAVQIKKSDYEKYDYILCMENMNVRNTLRIIGSDPAGKVRRLLEYSKNPRDISDPWFSGDFTTAYNDIWEGIDAFYEYLMYNGLCRQ
ncbi:MAG: low molecular weight phosphotyrosine protein phosphatase [Lachnospiraceae bacterium]|nr:low molecular weight phosphotyrosine protein phosphatase [Lachnospiraceae bacterium]